MKNIAEHFIYKKNGSIFQKLILAKVRGAKNIMKSK